MHQDKNHASSVSSVLYKRTVRLFEHGKYHILTAEFYCLVRPFDEKTYIGGTCYKQHSRNEIQCQDVLNKLSLDPISN